MMSHIKMHSSTIYHILLVEFGELLIELHALKLTINFLQQLAQVSPSWLVSKATSLSQHMVEHEFNTLYK